MPERTRTATIYFREETLPPNDPAHGTPDAVVRREIEFMLPEGTAHWEQTDYGHPGRFNPWDRREIDTRLQPMAAQLLEAAEAVGAVAGRG